MKKRILISGGGTLGHIIPIIPVVDKMLESGHYEFYFIGSINGIERGFIERTSYFKKTYYLDSRGLSRKLSFKNLISIYKYLKSKALAKKILKEVRPEIVIGMGGYVSAASITGSISLRIKTMINEQNSTFGLANKLLKNKVDKVLLSYKMMDSDNFVYVGNPRTTEIHERFKRMNPGSMEKTVLVVGGSRGAEVINELVFSLKDELEEKEIKLKLITGKKYYEQNKKKIASFAGSHLEIIDFTNDLPLLMFKSKVVVTRCGATTLAEVMALRKPSLLIPSPNVTANHQEKNGEFLARNNAAIMIKERDLTKENFMETILELINNNSLRSKIITNLNFISKDNSRELFIKEIEKMLE